MLNAFDKLCAGCAFLIGIVFIILGVLGLFAGCKAHFTLPPVLGVIPAFVGWGIVRPVVIAFRASNRPPPSFPADPFSPPGEHHEQRYS